MSTPARWRQVAEHEKLDRWQCDGDGMDVCRAPANWVAEQPVSESEWRVVAQRCLDHVPFRAIQNLNAPPESDPTLLGDTQPVDRFKSPPPAVVPPPSSSAPPIVTEIASDEDD